MSVPNPIYVKREASKEFNPVVSYDRSRCVLSMFENSVWDFTPYIQNRNVSRSRAVINFDVTLHNNSRLTDKVNQRLLDDLRDYLYTRLFVPHPKSGKTLKHHTLIAKYRAYQALINFVLANGINAVSGFRPVHTQQFIEYVRVRNPSVNANTLVKYLSIIEDLYHFQANLKHGIQQHPWPESSSIHLAGDRKNNGARFIKKTPRIPDYISADLLQKSVLFLKQHSRLILLVNNKLEVQTDVEFNKLIDKGIQYKSIMSDRADVNTIYAANRTYAFCKFRNSLLKEFGFESSRKLTLLTNTARTCCYIIIAMLTGMRNSEISSLKKGCLARGKGWDDEEYLWLHGLTYKLEDEPKPVKWMVPDIVTVAISHLEGMVPVYSRAIKRHLPYITDKEKYEQSDLINHLFVCKAYQSNTYNCVSNSHWNRELMEIANEFELVTKDAENDLKLEAGAVFPIKSHMFRRTYATFAARSALGDIRYLREHFKHISIDMSLHYAKHEDFDDTLFDEILTERNTLQRSLVSDWLTTETPLTGGRGETIATFRQRGQLKTADNQTKLLNQISDSVYVRGTGHSWCLASGDGCGGEGLYDALICSDCDNAVINRSLLPVWSEIEKQNQEILSLNDSGIGTKSHATKLIAVSKRIQERLA